MSSQEDGMVSDQNRAVIEMLRARPAPPPGLTFAEMRAGMEAMLASPIAADVTCTRLDCDGVPAEWIAAPGTELERAVLYLHGGGYVLGSVTTHRDLCARLSRAAGCRVLALDYRLAPEHPFPAAVEDAVAAHRWLLHQGFSPGRLAIAGDSAGGGLAVAALVALRERGVALPAAGVCLSPWADLAMTGDSLQARAALDPVVQTAGVAAMAVAYLAGADPRSPLASPLYADLQGLPPLLIQVGMFETLFDDAARLDARARCDGVEVRFRPWDEMVHVWHLFAAMLPEAQEAIEEAGAFIKEKTS
ncbi:MAG: alpha/beta hydrolase [Dehalococcoidia bacterium]|nr:alpha/beta hydrolase [Dehalococcoidia bacterium]